MKHDFTPLLLKDVKSIEEIYWFILEQGKMRSLENDEGGQLLDVAEYLKVQFNDLAEFQGTGEYEWPKGT